MKRLLRKLLNCCGFVIVAVVLAFLFIIVIVQQRPEGIIFSLNGHPYRICVNSKITIIPVIPNRFICVGNSITMHGVKEDVGWYVDDRAMAASRPQYDWPHRLLTYFKETNQSCQLVDQFNFSVWEKNPQSRDSYLSQLDSHGFDNTIDLVCIQLGENVSDMTTLYDDYIALIKYIYQIAPNAYVVLVSDFFQSTEKVEIAKSAAKKAKAGFVDISEYGQVDDFTSHIGDTIYKEDGTTFTVINTGVANHPSDNGFRWIAQKILCTITGNQDVILTEK